MTVNYIDIFAKSLEIFFEISTVFDFTAAISNISTSSTEKISGF